MNTLVKEPAKLSREEVFIFAESLVPAFGPWAVMHVIVSILGENGGDGCWINRPSHRSVSPPDAIKFQVRARQKFTALELAGRTSRELIQQTPLRYWEYGKEAHCEYLGGIRFGQYIVAACGFCEELDRLCAVLVLWAWAYGCKYYGLEEVTLPPTMVVPMLEISVEEKEKFHQFMTHCGILRVSLNAGSQTGYYIRTAHPRAPTSVVGVVLREK